MGLGAQETVTDANHSLNFDVHLTEDMDFKSSRIDGLWWALDDKSEARVVIANTRANGTSVIPTYFVGGIEYQGEAINLGGHESTLIDIEKALRKLHVQDVPSLGGISLNYTNGPGSIAVVGVITNKHMGFSTTMRFIDAASQKTTTLHGANLPIGKPAANSGFASTARFTPHVVARNNSAQPVEVRPRIRYTIGNQSNVIDLAAQTLSANEVRELDLSAATSAIGNSSISDAGIEIEHTGQPGAVMANAASVDQSGSHVFDVPHQPKNGS
jgi:hypothetical protein